MTKKRKVILITVGVLFLFCISKCGNNGKNPSNAKVQKTENVTEAQQETASASQSSKEATDAPQTENPTEKTNSIEKATYQFKWLGSTATLKLEVESGELEGTAQLIFKGKTYYGLCNYDKNNTKTWRVTGFTGTDAADMGLYNQFKGESWYWSVSHYIDLENNYLYLGNTEYKTKNPDYRVEMTRIE